MTVTLNFHGAAGTVTGSCYRIVHPGGQFLVDCGMFQGNKSVRELNLKPDPFDPKAIDYVLLTHAHIDHCGLLPKLVRNGFAGKIWMTAPTAGLLEYLLLDSAGIQESDADRDNRYRARRNEPPVEPLYTLKDAEETLTRRQTVNYEEWMTTGTGVRARYWNAGHILGSASIEVEVEDDDGSKVTLLFSGDLGPDEKVFYKEPDAPAGFDYILSESTYGGREREDYTLEQRRELLKAEINEGLARGGNIVIPAFAVERSQELLHDIGVLIKQGEINPQLVFLDSPLASKVTAVYRKYAAMFEDVELGADELFNDPRFRIVQSVDESKAINSIKGGAIILSASGMADAGRVKHHLLNNLPRKNSTALFVGYQAPGTLGQIIQSGARDVKIFGQTVPVRAQVRSLSGYSAHADHSELMAWITERLPAHGAIFLTHGEDEERAALRAALVTSGLSGDQVVMPLLDDAFDLRANGVAGVARPQTQRIDPAQIASDWHNAYAAFSIDLGHLLDGADSDARRLAIMTALQKQLGALDAPATVRVAPSSGQAEHAEPGGE